MINPALEPLEFWFQPGPDPLLPQLRTVLAHQAQQQAGPAAVPLRWAITAADPSRGLRLEAMVLTSTAAL